MNTAVAEKAVIGIMLIEPDRQSVQKPDSADVQHQRPR